MKKPDQFSVKKKAVVFSKGPIHLVDCEVHMGSGKTLSRQIIEHPGSVVIIPRFSKSRYVLIRQFRFAAGEWLWEFPAGGLEQGENLRQAAARELMEEIGYKPGKLKKLISFYPSPGISSEIMHLFLAEGLRPQKEMHDEDEEIEMQIFSVKDIDEMITRGKIKDGKTILGFYLLTHQSLL